MSHEHAEDDDLAEASAPEPTAEDLRGVVEEISSHYPPPRLGTELVLLEVSPHRAHAYWNIDVEDYRAAQKQTGLQHAPLVLRLYDITDGTPPEKAITAFDVEIQGLQGHWYLDLWKDGRTHVADLGFRAPDGRLIPLARSNPVSTPAAAESPDYHTLALDIAHPAGLRVTDLVLDPHLSPENTDVETGAPLPTAPLVVAPPVVTPAWTDRAAEPAPAGVDFQPSQEPVAAPPDKMHEDVQAIFERAVAQAADVPVDEAWRGHQSVAGPAPEGWPSAETLERLVPAGTGELIHPGPTGPAPEAPASGPEALSQPEAPAAPPAPPPPAPSSLDQYVSLSSFEHGRREVALEVNVELHVYGRAKPGTELTLYGQPVPLRPDGTFSIRKPLPQGAVVLPLLAVDPPAPAPES